MTSWIWYNIFHSIPTTCELKIKECITNCECSRDNNNVKSNELLKLKTYSSFIWKSFVYYAINKIQHYTFSLFYNNLHRLHSTFLHAKFSSEYYTSFILLIISILLTDRDSFTAPHQSIWIEMSLSFVARYYILIKLKIIIWYT